MILNLSINKKRSQSNTIIKIKNTPKSDHKKISVDEFNKNDYILNLKLEELRK